jgi:radical SAM-linked protein
VQRLCILFAKGDLARFLSHLDLMATFEYAARRAGLPVELSEGFNPRPRMAAAAPLALGYLGEEEILEIVLREPLPLTEVRDRLQATTPPGISILAAEEMPPGRKSAASRLQSAIYRVDLPGPVPDLAARVERLLRSARLEVEEPHRDRVRRRDLRPLLLSLTALDANALRLAVRLDGEGTIRPEQILALMSIPAGGARIVREKIALRD